MITTLFFWGISFILKLIAGASNVIAKDWTVWPSAVLDGLTYFFTNLMNFDFFLNIYQMLLAMKWLVGFLIIYISVRLLLKLFNFLRGSGELEI